MKKLLFLCLFSIVTLLLLPPLTHAVLLVGEQFNYADGAFNGSQNGGYSYDANNKWTSAWNLTGSSLGITLLNNSAYSNPLGVEHDASISRSFTENQAANTTLYFQATIDFQRDNEGTYTWVSQFLGGTVQFGVKNDSYLFQLGSATATSALPTRPFTSPQVLTGKIEFNPSGQEILTFWINASSEADAFVAKLSAEIGATDLGTSWTAVLVDLLDQNRMYFDNLKLGTDFGFSAGPAPVPEPATMLLLGSGLIGLVGLGRKNFFKKA